MQSPFWLKDPTILFNRDKIGEIWPTSDMSPNDKLNAVTRLVIILSILGYLVTKNVRVIVTGLVTLVAITILQHVQKNKKQNENVKKEMKEGFENLTKPSLDIMPLTRPKENNPVMNVLLPQIQDEPQRPAAAPAFNPVIEEEINDKTQEFVVNNFDNKDGIDERLFKDLGDSFQFDRSMRQWYSNPSTTIPNDQKSFAEFCYGDMISCKEGNGQACERQMPPHWING